MQFKKATRKAVKLKMNLSAPSGAGKTMSALLLAKGLVGEWGKIGVIDTENGSASLYSHLGDFQVLDLEPPFTPERYVQAIKAGYEAGFECLIIDSSTHEWSTLVAENEIIAQTRFKGNTWASWSVSNPRHDNFLNTILHTPVHIITCTRSKTETVQEGGKVKKIGMKDQQRDGWEYELTVSLEIDRDTHMATASKDRTNLFEGRQPFVIDEKTGQEVRKWCDSGVSVKVVAMSEMEIVQDIESLKTIWSKYKELQTDKDFIKMKDKRKEDISKQSSETDRKTKKDAGKQA